MFRHDWTPASPAPDISRTARKRPQPALIPLCRPTPREAEAVEAISELYSVVAAVEFESAPDDLGPGGSFTHLKSVQFVDGQTLNRGDTGAVSGEDVLSIMEHSLKERVGKNWEADGRPGRGKGPRSRHPGTGW